MKNLSRRLPQSHLETKTALDTAKATLAGNPPGPKALKDQTATELATWFKDFNDQYDKVAEAQAAMTKYTPTKNKSRDKTRQYCSQFMHAIDFEIEQGVLEAGDRAYYGIDVASGNFLPLSSEADIKESAGLLIKGEGLRVKAGGTPIVYPTIASLTAASDDYVLKTAAYVNLNKTLEMERGKLNDMTTNAIDFIKKMWNEVESTYAAEPIESRREKSRAWGVVYAFVTENIPVKLTVVDAETGQPIEGAEAMLEEAKKKAETDAEGVGELFTPIEGDDVLKIEAEGYVLVEMPIDTTDGKALELNIEMQKAA